VGCRWVRHPLNAYNYRVLPLWGVGVSLFFTFITKEIKKEKEKPGKKKKDKKRHLLKWVKSATPPHPMQENPCNNRQLGGVGGCDTPPTPCDTPAQSRNQESPSLKLQNAGDPALDIGPPNGGQATSSDSHFPVSRR